MINVLSEKEDITLMAVSRISWDREAWKHIKYMMLKYLKRKVITYG